MFDMRLRNRGETSLLIDGYGSRYLNLRDEKIRNTIIAQGESHNPEIANNISLHNVEKPCKFKWTLAKIILITSS
jgi:hypothetical protein